MKDSDDLNSRVLISSSSDSLISKESNSIEQNFNIDIEEVRWFYRNDLEKPSVLAKDKKNIVEIKWTPFNKEDSYALEVAYRKGNDSEPIQVLDGLYEVNISKRNCNSIYYKAKPIDVMRSIWFTDSGEPFEEKSSQEIDKKHNELFKDQISKETNINTNVASNEDSTEKKLGEPITSLTIDEGIVIWYSKDDIYWEKSKMSVIDKMHLTILKLRKKLNHCNRIKRGLKDNTENRDKSNELTHLVFVIHGIAQKLDRKRIFKCCEYLGKGCEKKKKEFFPNSTNHKFMFLPVDWRSSLILDDGIVESITIKNIQYVRSKLNYSALDIMYYSSPLYKTEIMNSLSSELNRLYSLFCEKNKYFKQKNGLVSLIAHSLGSVVVYDVLTSNTRLFNNYGEDTNREEIMFNHLSRNDSSLVNEYLSCKKRIQDIELQLIRSNNKNITPLEFQIENLFCLGSPLAVFLALRGVRPDETAGTQEHILPKNLCKYLFNIFHPSDPVAYRLEPLILKNYSKTPLLIHKCDTHIFKAPLLSYDEINRKRYSVDSNNLSKLALKNEESNSSDESINHAIRDCSDHNRHIIIERAIDYQLQESNFELVAILTSHNCYWKSADTALFISSQLIQNEIENHKTSCL